jgi:copper transport protein
VARFSPFALGSVIALAITGVVQAIIEVGSFSALVDTAYGRAVLIKVTLLCVLIGFGAMNRQRLIPALRRRLSSGETTGQPGLALRRNLRAEVSLIGVVLAVTAALVSYPPGNVSATGPASGRTTIGPAELEYVVDPARVGPNQIHLFLFNAGNGTPFTQAKEVTVDATQTDAQIGPIPQKIHVTRPGRYTVQGVQLGVPGNWTVTVTIRTSRFDEYEAKFGVSVR